MALRHKRIKKERNKFNNKNFMEGKGQYLGQICGLQNFHNKAKNKNLIFA